MEFVDMWTPPKPIIITDIMRWRAKKSAARISNLNNSITKGDGALAGCLGQELFAAMFPTAEFIDSYDYDFLFNGLRVEVKTIRRTVPPQSHFKANLSAYNHTQQADVYVFVQVQVDLQTGYLLGYLHVDEFFNKAILHKKDSFDGGVFKYQCDTYSLTIDNLNKLDGGIL